MKLITTAIAVSALSVFCLAGTTADAQPAQANVRHARAEARVGKANGGVKAPVRAAAHAKGPARANARAGTAMKGRAAGAGQRGARRRGGDVLGRVLNTAVRSAIKAQRSKNKNSQSAKSAQPKQPQPAK